MKAKCVAVLVVVVIALGAAMAITGCESKKCTKAPATKAAEKAPAPAKK
jgi:flagellar basal body-associated protein FliL